MDVKFWCKNTHLSLTRQGLNARVVDVSLSPSPFQALNKSFHNSGLTIIKDSKMDPALSILMIELVHEYTNNPSGLQREFIPAQVSK